MHILILHPQKDGSIPLARSSAYLYYLWCSHLAAFFEDGSSLFLHKFGEKERNLEKADALAYGLGHGGLELIFLGLISLLNLYISFSASKTQNPQVMITV